jgi:trehalose 6-phosphate synthase/phosphatase
MAKTILVSNRLPVRIDAEGHVTRTTGGLASALAAAQCDGTSVEPELAPERALWVGWPGAASEDLRAHPDVSSRLAALGLAPVLLGQAELDAYYEGYSNATLWPVLHALVTRAEFRPEWFAAYEAVNRRFVEVTLESTRPGDSIWIHDFHLFLAPRMLREARSDIRIGFFLHTPFPSSELFRTVPEREALLEGVLGADLIGFHTYSYLRHFRSALLRVLGVESEMDGVRCRDHTARLGVHPIGHDHSGFAAALAAPEFARAFHEHGAELGAQQLALSVERLDYTKGVPQKLAAIRRFLERNPELRRNTVFLLIAVPSRQGIREYDLLTEQVQREVGALNGEFGVVGRVPVQFLHQSFPQSELAALYALADVCVVTPLIDGMNLVAKEFIACKAVAPEARPGVLVLSEFAGAAQEMSEALLVNPYDIDAVAATIAQGLQLSHDERRRRTAAMGPRLVRRDAKAWAQKFLFELAALDTAPPRTRRGEDLAALAEELARAVQGGRRLALFLDYDGTLRSFTASPDAAVPDQTLRALLRGLAAREGVDIAVVSGRPSEFLERHLGDLGVTLVAEHGYCWRRADASRWEHVQPDVDAGWKDNVRPVLQQAVDLTPGTTLEEKRSALVWHYRRAEPDFGAWRAHLLLAELTDVTASLPVVVHLGRKIVEVSSQLFSKGAAVRHLVGALEPDIVLAAGDDQTDETMFALDLGPRILLHTIGIGEGPSRAQRRTDIDGLRACLERLQQTLGSGR